MHRTKPIIGVVPDHKDGAAHSSSKRAHYIVNCTYIESLTASGAAPIILPYDYLAIHNFLKLIDGLMIIGGDFDINPLHYGENHFHPSLKLHKTRGDFEYKIMTEALKMHNLPLLGICGGMQLLAVLNGGKILQHIPDAKENFIDHEQRHNPDFTDYHKPYHQIKIDKKSKLFSIAKIENTKVNSSHHQAVESVGGHLTIGAHSSDGIIEAIENHDHPFCLGVQWHPELGSSEIDEKIFSAFVAASKDYKNNVKRN